MKKERREIKIGTQVFWGKFIVGIFWIISGILGCFDNLVCRIIHLIFAIPLVVISFTMLRATFEPSDEMAEQNLTQAKAKTRDIMHYIFCIAAIIAALVFGLLGHRELSWPRIIANIFFILMGLQDLVTGLIFRSLEAE